MNPFLIAFLTLVFLALVIIVMTFIYSFFHNLFHPEEKAAFEKKLKEIKEATEKAERNTAKKIYNKCKELKIKIDKPEQEEKLLIVAASFNVTDIKKAKELYTLGEKLIKEERQQNEKIKLENLRKKEKETYDKQKKEADRNNRSKYTYIVEYHRAMDALNKAMNDAKVAGAYNMIKTQASSHDWAFLGGIANGLGGGAVGLATASQIQQENASAEKEAKIARERGWLQLEQAQEESKKYKPYYTSNEKEQEEYINSRLFDSNNPYEKLSFLKFENISLNITKGKNFVFQATIRCEQIFKLLDKPSILDGSIKINVKNSNNQIIGTGYFAAPGAGELDLSKVGFYNGITFQSICWVENYESVQKNQIYTYEIQPYYLWLIEL